MKYAYHVTFNGVDYAPYEEVPNEKGAKVVKAEEPKKETIVKTEEKATPTFTKTDINRMPIDELKKIAKKEGIDLNTNGADLKKALIEKFGL